MKMNNFRPDPSDISAETATLLPTIDFVSADIRLLRSPRKLVMFTILKKDCGIKVSQDSI